MIHCMVEMVPIAQPIVPTPTALTILILQTLTTEATQTTEKRNPKRRTLTNTDANASLCQEWEKSSYARTFR